MDTAARASLASLTPRRRGWKQEAACLVPAAGKAQTKSMQGNWTQAGSTSGQSREEQWVVQNRKELASGSTTDPDKREGFRFTGGYPKVLSWEGFR